jgi:predicted RNA-binding protein with PUA-like domain
MARWLLQCNPIKWRIFDFFEAGQELTSWTVNRYMNQMAAGDDFALWVTGSSGGVVGLGKVVGSPEKLAVEEIDDEYWSYDVTPEAIRWQIPIELTDEFLKAPVLRSALTSDARFANSLIVKQPRGGNPFPLTEDEWSAIIDHRQDQLAAPTDQGRWTLRPGDTIRRAELHAQYGGSGQGGIAPSRTTPNVFIFTDPKTGNQHGYYDEWAEDGTFRYAGQGQLGDQEFTSGNKAIRDHAVDGRALRVFEGAGGIVRYAGEFVLDPREPFSLVQAHASGGGKKRTVIQFHLRRCLEPEADKVVIKSIGSAYRPQNERADVAPQAPKGPPDPDAYGRGLRHHRRLQNCLVRQPPIAS